jgi:hypothetical protein
MLIIPREQIAAFNANAAEAFITRLEAALGVRYPHVLGRFPPSIQHRIVTNMVQRAQRWGITWQSSLAIFAELMLAVAANFDEQEAIRQELRLQRPCPNRAMKAIFTRVPPTAWNAAAATASALPLYVPGSLVEKPLVERTATALTLVLWDRLREDSARRLADEASAVAADLHLDEVEDAALVIGVWMNLYGPGYWDSSIHKWLRTIFYSKHGARTQIAMIRLRIAIDYGRRV